MPNLLIYTSKITPRLNYILNCLFQPLQIPVELSDDSSYFLNTKTFRINYSDEIFENIPSILPHGILTDYNIKDYQMEIHRDADFQCYFFKTGSKNHLAPFDILGAAFWLLSRYEEYLPYKGDALNRFHYKNSLAWQSGFLNRPLVNDWMNCLIQKLKAIYPDLNYDTPEYSYTHTIDIDTAFKYKYKGFVRTMSGTLKDISRQNFKSLKHRLNVVFGRTPDPFDVYAYLHEIHSQIKTDVIFFFLLGDYGLNDKNHSSVNTYFQTLIKHLSDYYKTGIHPSFKSNSNISQLKIECQRLAQINHLPVRISRQHYSMLRFPATYQSLTEAGIEHDYSMGYNESVGFRASYCYPYKWYNLEEEQVSALTIHPFAFNETAFAFSKTDEANSLLETITALYQSVKSHGGELIGVFHNDSFEVYKDKHYKAFYEKILQLCVKHKKN